MPRKHKRYEWKARFKRVVRKPKKSGGGAYEITTAIRPAPKIDRRHGLDAEKWVESGRWVYGRSSNVGGLMYDKSDNRLFVQFSGGSVYYYLGVPIRVAVNFFNASSLGKYLHHFIKGKYAYAGPYPMGVSYR